MKHSQNKVFLIFIDMENINEPEDIFKTKEFKSLPLHQRVWLRIKIAFFQTISLL